MKFFTFSILFCFTLLAFGQDGSVSGKLLDFNTKAPIPYCNINVLESGTGTSSLESGLYYLDYRDADLKKQVLISNIGYKDTIIPLAVFKDFKELFLKRESTVLDEVVLTSLKYENETEVKGYDELRENYSFLCNDTPNMYAVFFSGDSSYNKTPLLKAIRVNIVKNRLPNVKFRVRVYSNSQNNYPLRDLIIENLIVSVKKKQKLAYIDVSEYKLKIPLDGIHIALERLDLPSNKKPYKRTVKNYEGKKEVREGNQILPEFLGGFSKDGSALMSYSINGRWKQIKKSSTIYELKREVIVPAISIILTD